MTEIKEIIFRQDTAERKKWFRGLSFSHPAKMSLGLQIYLIEYFTKPGDTILDPMLGSGSILVACAIGRSVIGIELEQKFADMAKANWDKIKSLGPILGYTMGTATILQGDARQLPEVLADCAIFSPPYAETESKKAGGFMRNYDGRKSCDIPKEERAKLKEQVVYSDNPSNIGNLKYGSIDSIVTSPPYEGSISGKELPESEKLIARKSGKEKWGKHLRLGKSQLTKYADSIICSPPYEGIATGNIKADAVEKRKVRLKKAGYNTDKLLTPGRLAHGNLGEIAHYNPDNQDNIGNLKGESYLHAMLQVYRGCHQVLREKGLIILVTKNFIRNKKIIRLDLDTIRLCEQAGFRLKERLARKLTQKSFWRTLQFNKCDYRTGKKCKLGLSCPTKKETKTLFNLGMKEKQIIEKLCPKYINTVPPIIFEDILVMEKKCSMRF